MDRYVEYPTVIKKWGVVDDTHNIYNSCVLIKEYSKPLRARSEMLIVKGKSLFMLLLDDGYKLPGGTWDENETSKNAAIRETQEEARLNTKNVKYRGCYAEIGNVSKWVYKNIQKEDWWYGHYTEVFIGTYDGKYDGYIAKEDMDKNMYKKGKFYPINLIYDRLRPIHKNVLEKYLAQ